jgi:putative peptidoglycan lipid II flippase
MVKRVLSLMTREVRGLHEAAYVLAAFAFLSQILALVRDRLFALLFGAGATLDAYFAAFRIPDVAFALLTLFVSSFALVPLIAARGGAGSFAARSLIGAVLIVFGMTSIVIATVLFYFMPHIVPLALPGLSEETVLTTVLLSRIILLQPIILGLSSVVASVLQSSSRFFLYALAPIFYNLGIIIGALFLYPSLGVVGLAWGVVLGAALHFLVQLLPLLAMRIPLPRFSQGGFKDIGIVFALSVPRALAVSANQLLLLAFAGAASLATAGSIAVVSFGFNLQSFTLSIVGVSYASALFPSLARLHADGQRAAFTQEVWAVVRHIIFWTAPAIALIVVLRAHLVRVVLGAGAFTWSDTRLTAALLAAFGISLTAQAALLVFSRAYYAAGRSIEPIAVNVLAALAAGILAFTGVSWFQSADVSRYLLEDIFRISGIAGSEVVMIALSYSVVFSLFALIFAWLFARRFGFERRTLTTLILSFGASLIGALAAYGTLQIFGPLLPTETFVGIFAQGAAAGIVGIGVWALALALLGSREFLEVVAILRRFFIKING